MVKGNPRIRRQSRPQIFADFLWVIGLTSEELLP